MNYSINLLPPHLRPQTGIETKYLLAGALILLFVVCGGLLVFQVLKQQQAQRELTRITQEIQLLQPAIQQTQKNKALKSQIDVRTNLLAQIEKERPVKWSELILQLGQVTPDNLWLIQLTSDANGIVNMRGGANDIETVTQYTKNLRQIPSIANVAFVGLVQGNTNDKVGRSPDKEAEIRGLNVVMYDLSVQIKGGAKK
jgi:Tfp pilus assembly protein PilN